MTWKTILSFILGATILTLLSAWSIGANLLPIATAIDYRSAELSFIQIWLQLAIAIGVLLPGVAFLVWMRDPKLRTVFGFYLLVLGVQIASELIFSRVFFSSLLAIVGTLYTTFRIWQLWQGKYLLSLNYQSDRVRDRVARGLLWLLLLFWSANLIFVLPIAWLTIII